MLVDMERIKSSLMLAEMQASNSYCGFESWSVRQPVCEFFLQAPMRRERSPFHGLYRTQKNHHAAHKWALNSANCGAFGALSPGHDCRVVVSDADP
jgi:hypothetical protein